MVIGDQSKSQRVGNRADERETTAEIPSTLKLPQSPELEEYRASMRQFLVTREQTKGSVVGRKQDNNRPGVLNHCAISIDQREQSPESQWMDLETLRRKHELMMFDTGLVEKGTRSLTPVQRISSPSCRQHNHHHCINKQSRHFYRECCSASPSSKSALSGKKHSKLNAHSQMDVQPCGYYHPLGYPRNTVNDQVSEQCQ